MAKSDGGVCHNLNDFVDLYQYVGVSSETEYLPEKILFDAGAAINIGINEDSMAQILYSRFGEIAVRGYAVWDETKWKQWMILATTTPPKEFDLPMAEGLSVVNPCTYRKNQFGEVSVGGAASGTIEVGTAIATLPSGFRPIKTVERPAVYSVDGAWTGGTVVITTDGIVRAYGQLSATSMVFTVDFVAD